MEASTSSGLTQMSELRGVAVLPGGEGFTLEVQGRHGPPVRLQFPVWTLHQLMRLLPRVDAALQQSHAAVSGALPAYPVVDWCIEAAGLDSGLALCLRTDRDVESGYAFELGDARRFLHELGAAIDRAQAPLSAPAATSAA